MITFLIKKTLAILQDDEQVKSVKNKTINLYKLNFLFYSAMALIV